MRWGVIGVGLAGSARVRALRADPRADVIMGYRGDPQAAGVEVAGSLYELLGSVEAVAVCSPDRLHPEHVQAALEAACHVVCEFPLAGTADDAERLFALARERGRVLHVEHIELLGPEAGWIRERCRGRGFRGGSLRFVGGPRPDAWSMVHANVARFHRLLDAVGPPVGHEVHYRDESEFAATLSYRGGAVLVEFRHEAGARRRTEMVLELDDGTITQMSRTLLDSGVPVSLPESPGLFAADQLVATARILDGAPPYVSDERVVDVLRLAGALDQESP